MGVVEWRYRTRRGGPLSAPVSVFLPPDGHRYLTSLAAKMRALPEGSERAALLNEITTVTDIHAVFPGTEASYEEVRGDPPRKAMTDIQRPAPSRAATVKLSASEVRHVAVVGVDRRIAAIQRRRTEPYGTPETDLWGNDIESCAAEYVVARVTGLFWNVETGEDLSVTPPDVGDDVQVRYTKHKNGHLPVYDKDEDGHFYVLVLGEIPAFTVAGFILGVEAKCDAFRRVTPRGVNAYWVPQDRLTPIGQMSR